MDMALLSQKVRLERIAERVDERHSRDVERAYYGAQIGVLVIVLLGLPAIAMGLKWMQMGCPNLSAPGGLMSFFFATYP